MVNGYEHIFYEKQGRICRWERGFSSREKLEDVIQSIVAAGNRMVNEAAPIVDTRLRDGSRVNIVLNPIAIDGSVITIRKFPERPMQMEDLLGLGSLSCEMAKELEAYIQAGYNIFVSGGTGSGKTTFLNALSGYIPSGERVITIEDSAELQLNNVPNLVRLETRSANLEQTSEISIRQLIRTALRMRPDRIIVGECRGPEALDMLQAMNTGHDGSLSTGHANSCQDMLRRLETMVLMGMELPVSAIRAQIASGIDILVHLGRLRDRTRKVLDIMEVLDYAEGEIRLQPLYHFVETGEADGRITGEWQKRYPLAHRDKLRAAGLEAGNGLSCVSL
jgi:pilus assembly protein CpaF